MRPTVLAALMLCTGVPAPVAAATPDAPIAAPSFSDLESGYPRDTALDKAAVAAQMLRARAAFDTSVPAGIPVAQAEARLRAAGATCRADRRPTGAVRCLYHQYDLSDGAADDIRWTVQLGLASGAVADLSVSRYVDRHGPN